MKQKVEASVTLAGDTFSDQFDALSTSTNVLLVKSPFPEMILNINQGTFPGHAGYFSEAMAETSSFIQNNDFINNVILYGEGEIVFSPSSLGIADTMKLLLQPLVENCIKHGFRHMESSFAAVSPQITISIQALEDNYILLEVSDNGRGFDLETANDCLESSIVNGQKHFGLHNLSRRLKIYYGRQAFITISSIPYLKNSVAVRIPLSAEKISSF